MSVVGKRSNRSSFRLGVSYTLTTIVTCKGGKNELIGGGGLSTKKRIIIILAFLITSVAVDQYTKVLAIQKLKNTPTQIFLGDTFRLQYAENNGAFLSLGSGLSDQTRFWTFTVLVTGFLLGLAVYLVKKKDLTMLEAISYSLVLGGGIGNLIDRWARNGWVVDFMNMGIGDLRTGIFNVADAVIMAGMFGLIFQSLTQKSNAVMPSGKMAEQQSNP